MADKIAARAMVRSAFIMVHRLSEWLDDAVPQNSVGSRIWCGEIYFNPAVASLPIAKLNIAMIVPFFNDGVGRGEELIMMRFPRAAMTAS
jgi:hypothetical protein